MSPLDNAKLFLEQKLRETIAECDVPALSAVLVRDEGHTIVAGQQGIRKVGATGVQNNIQPHDKFNLGSISKVFTGNLIGKLIQNGVGNLQWDTKLIDVYPTIGIIPGMHSVYKNVTIEQFLEHTSGKTYEDLMEEHIYNPLGMTNSGFGVLSLGVLDGTWQHGWDSNSFTINPDLNTKKDAYSWHPRNPVGGECCSAADMGKFLQEQVRPDPQVFDKATRATMQTHQVTTASNHVRGAWVSSEPGSTQADIWHNGDNGVSYAHIVVSLSQKIGYGAMSNVNITFGAPAVNEMHEVARAMHSNWNALFTDPNAKFWECAHPMPAVVLEGQKMIVFGRQHDGKVLRRRSTN